MTGPRRIDLRPIADGVFVARTDPLDVNVTVVLGDDTALVVDTLSTEAQARELRDAIRAVTALPLTVLVTHFHFDHAFGAAVLAADGRFDDSGSAASDAAQRPRAVAVWGHPYTATELRDRGRHWQLRWYDEWATAEPELAAGLTAATIHVPDHLVPESEVVDLGGRTVSISHPGRGHTAGDLVAYVPDADVLVAGDLVEEGNPPDFSDAYPLNWPEALAKVLDIGSPSAVVIPGHGAVVDKDFVAAQHAQLASFDWLIRAGHRDGGTVESVASRGPYPARTSRVAVARGFAALDGH